MKTLFNKGRTILKSRAFIAFVSLIITSSALLSGQDSVAVSASENNKFRFKITADLVSSYIWRGTVASSKPNVQPTMAILAGNFEAGVWGSTDFLSSYKELDPYIAYTIKWFRIGITDYDWNFKNPNYFDYKESTTDHIIEVNLSYADSEGVPMYVSLNTMIYGADKKWDKESGTFTGKQNYSSYAEFGWAFKPCTVFFAVTPFNGYYGAGYGRVGGFACCNLGVISSRNIKITRDFSLPVKGALYINPQAESIHFTIGITI